jgi:predicted Zn finger-like uncharacterized protein
MLIVCPNCKTKFSFETSKISTNGINLRCSKCSAIFRVIRKTALSDNIAPPKTTASAWRIKVVVANESPTFCAAIKKVLSPEPFDLYMYNDGKEALEEIERLCPEVILLDVALPSMYGFEVCERIRKNPLLASVKIILIASIYDKTRYKRSPNSLYGADDYIEKHHIPDLLISMIYRLAGNQKPLEDSPEEAMPQEEVQVTPQHLTRNQIDAQEGVRKEIQHDEEIETGKSAMDSSVVELSEAQIKAKRLARIIVSDIFLYNQSKVEDGIRNGNLFDLLSDDIKEGQALYIRRVPELLRNTTSYLEEAFQELIDKKKASLNL